MVSDEGSRAPSGCGIARKSHGGAVLPKVELRKLPLENPDQVCIPSHDSDAVASSNDVLEDELGEVRPSKDRQSDAKQPCKSTQDFAIAHTILSTVIGIRKTSSSRVGLLKSYDMIDVRRDKVGKPALTRHRVQPFENLINPECIEVEVKK